MFLSDWMYKMSEFDITQTTTSKTIGAGYELGSRDTDSTYTENTIYTNSNWTKWYDAYRTIDKIKRAIDAYASWILGKGYDTDTRTKVILESITGWGEDTFNHILWNLLVIKKVNGDAYALVVREEGRILNLIVLNPKRVQHVMHKDGRIKHYNYLNATMTSVEKTIKPADMLHLCNKRVADEPHGISDVDSVQWIIEAHREAMEGTRRVQYLGTLRIIYYDAASTTELDQLKADHKTAIEKGKVIFVPKQTMEVADFTPPDTNSVLQWLRYLDDAFYMTIGVPKVILGGETSASEGGAKVAYIAFEPTYIKEVTELEADLWNQLAIKITFKRQESIAANMQQNEQKNTSQTSFQPKDTTATLTRE